VAEAEFQFLDRTNSGQTEQKNGCARQAALLGHNSMSAVNGNISSAGFGQIINANSARLVQVAGKFVF